MAHVPRIHYKGRDIVAKKKFGQNFLVDENIVRKIIALAELEAQDNVVEIGPGFGALTKELANLLPTFTAIELDKTLAAFIRAEFPQVTLIEQDVLKTSLSELATGKKLKILGNIPYAITSPILFKLIEERAVIHSAILMLQDEVAKRLSAKPRTKEYGILAVQLQAFAEVEYCFKIKRSVFKPKPEVDSAVVRLTMRHQTNIEHENLFRTLVRTAFRMRRKTLENNLKEMFELRGVSMDLKRRAEELSVQEFIELSKTVRLRADTPVV
ncbi:MAG: 16S rRNA (adenine(1518)-N(6)/adenine(1519)-N(6))-dimethyltransferase RsmA [Candidatus Thermochlorobacter sp.]